MAICRFLRRSVRLYSYTTTTTTTTNLFQTRLLSLATIDHHSETQSLSTRQHAASTPNSEPSAASTSNHPAESPISTPTTITDILNRQYGATSSPSSPVRSSGFSSAEEAAADRRRRKRLLRIQPPLRPNQPSQSKPPNTVDPRLPDPINSLTGPRLHLHNRVQHLVRAGDLDGASCVARQSVFHIPRPAVYTCSAIIAAMYRAKRYSDAKALFQYFFNQFNMIPDIASYNTLIACHCECNEIEEALKVYNYILENAPYRPSALTYRHLTKGLIDAERIDDAVGLLREMLHKGHASDSLVYNNLILGYLNMGNLEKANEFFDELKERCPLYDGVVNATFMDWFFKQGRPKEAMRSYWDLMRRDYRMVPATRNVILETLLRHGKKKEAWDLFSAMLDDHTHPTFHAVNSDTFNMMVNECFKEGNVAKAKETFMRVGKGAKLGAKVTRLIMDVAGYSNIIARFCELGMIYEAEEYCCVMTGSSLVPDVSIYSSLIDCCIKLDMIDKMLDKYSLMVGAGLRVIPTYANKWFGFLIKKDRVLDCVPILSKMGDKEPKPDFTTYDIVVRGLVEAGNYDETVSLFSQMMEYGVGSTVSLKEFLLDVFEKQGRRMEIENIIKRFSGSCPDQRSYSGSRGLQKIIRPPQITEQEGRQPAFSLEAPKVTKGNVPQPPQSQMKGQIGLYPGSRDLSQTTGPQIQEQGGWRTSTRRQVKFSLQTPNVPEITERMARPTQNQTTGEMGLYPGSQGFPQTTRSPYMQEHGGWHPSIESQSTSIQTSYVPRTMEQMAQPSQNPMTGEMGLYPESQGSPETMRPPQVQEQGGWNSLTQWRTA